MLFILYWREVVYPNFNKRFYDLLSIIIFILAQRLALQQYKTEVGTDAFLYIKCN